MSGIAPSLSEYQMLRADRDEAVRLLREAPVLTGYPDWQERCDAYLAAHPEAPNG